MGFYARHILPKVVDFACRSGSVMKQREKVVPLAKGRVLELGFGSGLNLPYYDKTRVTRVWALEPHGEMWSGARERVEAVPFPVEHLPAPAETVPLDDGTVDTVLSTFTLCTIPDPVRALAEARRVLKPGGALVFCEHGAAPDAGVLRWQNRLNPCWGRIGGGCHLNRPIPALLVEGGFRIEKMEAGYVPGWKPASFNYWGTAVPRQATDLTGGEGGRNLPGRVPRT